MAKRRSPMVIHMQDSSGWAASTLAAAWGSDSFGWEASHPPNISSPHSNATAQIDAHAVARACEREVKNVSKAANSSTSALDAKVIRYPIESNSSPPTVEPMAM